MAPKIGPEGCQFARALGLCVGGGVVRLEPITMSPWERFGHQNDPKVTKSHQTITPKSSNIFKKYSKTQAQRTAILDFHGFARSQQVSQSQRTQEGTSKSLRVRSKVLVRVRVANHNCGRQPCNSLRPKFKARRYRCIPHFANEVSWSRSERKSG